MAINQTILNEERKSIDLAKRMGLDWETMKRNTHKQSREVTDQLYAMIVKPQDHTLDEEFQRLLSYAQGMRKRYEAFLFLWNEDCVLKCKKRNASIEAKRAKMESA